MEPSIHKSTACETPGYMEFVLCFIAAISNGGKTTYIKKLLRAQPAFSLKHLLASYISTTCSNLCTLKWKTVLRISLPQKCFIEEYGRSVKSLLLVFDDMYQDVIGSYGICDLCLILSQHLNISCIFTSQYIYCR